MPLSQTDERLIQRILQEAGAGDRHLYDDLSEHEKQYVLKLVSEFRATGSCPSLDVLWEVDYRERPVPITTFLDDEYYFGKVGKTIYPRWREWLEETFAPGRQVWEVLLTGSIGTGKSTIGVVCLLYKLYQLSCLRDPQTFYEMAPGSKIVIGLYNVFKYKVETTTFGSMSGMIEVSPYFKEQWRRDPKSTTTIKFPSHVQIISGSGELHALGENLYGCLIDETDFMRAGATEDVAGQAYKLYTSTIRRMESRFMRFGQIPGMQILISSKTSHTGFLETRVQEQRGKTTTAIADFALWDVKPARYSGRKFTVYVGDQYTDPRILEEGETPPGNILLVPVEHRGAFEQDIHAALRDIAGASTTSSTALIPSRQAVMDCIDKDRAHPFTRTEFPIVLKDPTVIEDFLSHRELFDISMSQWRPRVRFDVPRYIHVDIGLTGDALGLAMGHCSGYKKISRTDETGFRYESSYPVVYMDFMLRVVPKPGDRIDLQKIRDFIVAIQTYGFKLALVTYDGYESEDSIQQLGKLGIKAEVFSMDRAKKKDLHPYMFLRQAILENRINYYRYDPFLSEVVNLERNLDKNKVDHPALQMSDIHGNKVKASKDVADAVGGVCRHVVFFDSLAGSGHSPVFKGNMVAQQTERGAPPQDHRWLLDDDEYDLDDVIGFQK